MSDVGSEKATYNKAELQKLVPKLPASEETCEIETPTGERFEVPLYQPVMGPKVIDGSSMYKKTGLLTFDPGFTSTASCVS